MLLTGLLQAFGLVLISVAFNVMIRFASLAFSIEAAVFACVSIVSAALVLSLFAGPGKLVSATLKTPATWAYGVSTIGVFVLDIYLSQYVTATEMSLFGRTAIPLSLAVSLFIFKRHQMRHDVFGLLFVLIGLYVLFAMQSSDVLMTILLLALATGVVQAGEVIFAETHKQSQKAHEAGNLRDKARVVGFVCFTTSMMFLALVFCASIVHQYWLPDVKVLAFLPPLERFAHAPSVWFGLFFGVFLSSTYRYLLWSSSYKLKSDNILALLAFVPLLTLACEWALSFTPYLAENESYLTGTRGQLLLLSCLLITFGSGLSVFLRVRNQFQHERTGHFWHDLKQALTIEGGSMAAIQHMANAMDDYEIITATLAHTHGDFAKTATLLGLPHDTLYVVHKSKGALALVPEASQKMARRYRAHVATRDSLTGLLNRTGFMAETLKHLENQKAAQVLFIDLNKFKPINDTYGHDAGDAVLRTIGMRLAALFPKKIPLTRLGGDEFCILLTAEAMKEKGLSKRIRQAIEEPIPFNGMLLQVSASIGQASYPQDGTNTEELIKSADNAMYEAKEKRR